MKFERDAFKYEPRLHEVEKMDLNFLPIFNPSTDIMYSSGSVRDGFGDRFSDIDIYLICANNQTPSDDECNDYVLPESGARFGYNVYNDENVGYWVEFIPFSMQWVEDTIEKINEIQYDDFDKILNLSYREYDLYYRIAIGEALINKAAFEKIKSRVDKAHICKILCINKGVKAAEKLSMAESYINEGNYEQAYYYAQSAVDYTIDFVLSERGESYPSSKVKFRKIERIFGRQSDFEKKAASIIALGNRTFEEYCVEAASFCSECGVDIYKEKNQKQIRYKIFGEIELIELVDEYCMLNGLRVFRIDKYSKQLLKHIQINPSTIKELEAECERCFETSNPHEVVRMFVDEGMKNGIITT